ncbi:hypothetical protein KJZ61_01295 [Candidatus Dependentiae bacterium]|nr:hypothetical protein [Candidatus Dependentiae bacterium]
MIMHKQLAAGRWNQFTLIEQLANIGSEVIRTINWKQKGNQELSRLAFERALELIDLTIADPKNRKRLREVVRTREALVDHFVYDNIYQTTDEIWYNYFFNFNYAAALQRGR